MNLLYVMLMLYATLLAGKHNSLFSSVFVRTHTSSIANDLFVIHRALQFPGEGWLRISICHTSLNVISILPSGRVILRTLGDGGHLPVEKYTIS